MEVIKSQYENKLQVRTPRKLKMSQKRMEVMKSHKRISWVSQTRMEVMKNQ